MTRGKPGTSEATAVKAGEATASMVVEALLFASSEPLDEEVLEGHLAKLPAEARRPLADVLAELRERYAARGVRVESSGKAGAVRWALRTAPEVSPYLERVVDKPRRLSRAAMETLAVIAWQQPVTRTQVEAIRGVPVTRGTLDLLLEAGWICPAERLDVPGRPVTWVTTPAFLDHFALSSLDDLPRLDELEAAGLFKPEIAAADEGTGEAEGAGEGETEAGEEI